ncbi:MAG TPA: endonuclease III [archaeon]|nr:endonuclease III [archaeon]
MPKKTKTLQIIHLLKKQYPDVKCSLEFKNNLQMMVSAMLSAQCSDVAVNKVTPALFSKFKTARDFADSKVGEIEKYIKTLGLYKTKAKNIKASCELLVEKHSCQVPNKYEDLIELPGIGRKIATVILSTCFGKLEGITIDTHNIRLAYRLGLTKHKDAKRIEQDLLPIVPKKYWDQWSLLMIYHGREICKARNPFCGKCVLNKLCPKVNVIKF